MTSKAKGKTLADKINSLLTTKPINFDSDDEDTKAKVVDRYDENDTSDNNLQVSKIRIQNVDPLDQLDKRYVGKKISRKEINNTNDDLHDISKSEESETMDSIGEDSNFYSSNDNSNDDISEDNNNNDNDNDDNDDDDNDDDDDDDDDNKYEEDDNDSDVDDDEIKEGNENDNSNQRLNYDHKASFKDKFNVEKGSYDESSNTEHKADFQTISHTNLRADIDKGNCIRSQLKLWENLLEIRIQLQKCLIISNQMPQYDVYKNLKENTEYVKKVDENKSKLKLLLNNMLQLQYFLLKQYPESKNLFTQSKKRKAEGSIDEEITNINDEIEEIPSDTEDEGEKVAQVLNKDAETDNKNMFNKKLKLDNYEKLLNENHKSYTDYRNSIIQKWNEKTKISSGKLNKGMNQSTLKQIEFALNDSEKLRKRSQLKRSEYKVVGKMDITVDDNEGRRIQEYDCEIYDDDDFYHQLLRDLIEYKSTGITDPIQLSKQWIQLQNMRRKLKRKIDTRATKGRRIRYNVHNKLVNFMAPITISDTWSDHAKDELYSSLFGKIKSTNQEVNC